MPCHAPVHTFQDVITDWISFSSATHGFHMKGYSKWANSIENPLAKLLWGTWTSFASCLSMPLSFMECGKKSDTLQSFAVAGCSNSSGCTLTVPFSASSIPDGPSPPKIICQSHFVHDGIWWACLCHFASTCFMFLWISFSIYGLDDSNRTWLLPAQAAPWAFRGTGRRASAICPLWARHAARRLSSSSRALAPGQLCRLVNPPIQILNNIITMQVRGGVFGGQSRIHLKYLNVFRLCFLDKVAVADVAHDSHKLAPKVYSKITRQGRCLILYPYNYMEHGVSQTEGLLYQAPQLGSKLMDDRGRVRWLLGQRHRYIEGVMWTSWHAIRNSLAQLFSPMSNVLPTHWSIAMFSLPLHRGKYSEGDFVYSRTMGPPRSFKWRLKVYPSGTLGTACLDSNRQCMLSQQI